MFLLVLCGYLQKQYKSTKFFSLKPYIQEMAVNYKGIKN